MSGAKQLSFDYDATTDVLTVEGVGYAGDVFRQIEGFLTPGAMYRCVLREHDDGTSSLVLMEER